MARTDWKDADGEVTSVEVAYGRGGPVYTVSFNYKVDDHWSSGFFTGNEEYKDGDPISVRYDPRDPDRNDLTTRENRREWMGWIVMGALVVWGLTALIGSLLKN